MNGYDPVDSIRPFVHRQTKKKKKSEETKGGRRERERLKSKKKTTVFLLDPKSKGENESMNEMHIVFPIFLVLFLCSLLLEMSVSKGSRENNFPTMKKGTRGHGIRRLL
jgi:hypothetical protein